MDKPTMENIPNELLIEIFKFVGRLKSAAAVCKR